LALAGQFLFSLRIENAKIGFNHGRSKLAENKERQKASRKAITTIICKF